MLSRLKHALRKLALSWPRKVHCTVCDWRGRRFISDGWHPRTICPNCGSQVRHRLLVAALASPRHPLHDLFRGRRVLHFAPEPLLQAHFSAQASHYRTADYLRDDVDLQVDMCDLSVLDDGSVDVVVACDVLEHVPDDGAAMSELHRILSKDGWAVLTVPQKDGLASTYEDPSITTEAGRLEAFGQEDHLRIYGDDFPQLLEARGFDVIVMDETAFAAKKVKCEVLFPPVLSSHPLATNHRKVFFARKRSA